MSYTRFKGTFLSSNGIDRVNYYIFEPESDIRAIVQFAHGWIDYMERNENLINFFTSHGILVCGCDFIGHDIEEKDNYGDFKMKNAWTYLVEDLMRFSCYIKKTYKDTPIFLYGHGLGSLVARMTIIQNIQYDGVIISGTSGKRHFCRRAKIITFFMKRWKGPTYRSPFLQRMMIQKSHYQSVDTFYCMGALRDMFHMLSQVSKKTWYKMVPKDLPILLISGSDDPVGLYGKGILEIKNKLQRENCNINMKLYEGMRHNIQDESDRNIVFQDVLMWMKDYLDE